MRNYKIYISDILDCIHYISDFIGESDYDEFIDDNKTSSAVVLKLIVIGESTKNVPDRIREKYPDVPWKGMTGLRDRIAHGYFGIDYEIIWEVIKEQLPTLEPEIARMLDEMDSERR